MADTDILWNPKKNAANKRKHGISLEEAQTVFADERAQLLDDPEHSHSEARFVAHMKREYDFSKARRNPYASRLKQPVTIRLDAMAVKYFKDLAAASGIPYQTLINLYLRDCAATKRKLDLQWKPERKGAA